MNEWKNIYYRYEQENEMDFPLRWRGETIQLDQMFFRTLGKLFYRDIPNATFEERWDIKGMFDFVVMHTTHRDNEWLL